MTLEQQIAQFVASGLVNGAIYALLGLGLVVIASVTRVVNVAQGEFAAFGALLAASAVGAGVPLGAALLLAVAAATALGAGAGRYGMLIWVAPQDYAKAATALGAT